MSDMVYGLSTSFGIWYVLWILDVGHTFFMYGLCEWIWLMMMMYQYQ
jgi:hypothetical protein